jgi:hypothetical protein
MPQSRQKTRRGAHARPRAMNAVDVTAVAAIEIAGQPVAVIRFAYISPLK